jgi:hypothetical protein
MCQNKIITLLRKEGVNIWNIANIVKVDNKNEYGASLELFDNTIRAGLFTSINPFGITILFGIWSMNIVLQIGIGKGE